MAEDDEPEYDRKKLVGAMTRYQAVDRLRTLGQRKEKGVIEALDNLVDRINIVLGKSHQKGYLNEFSKTKTPTSQHFPSTDWDSGIADPVIATFAKLAAHKSGQFTPANRPEVPKVPYSVAKRYLPWSLCFLIEQVYAGWRTGVPLDTRSELERGDRDADLPPSIGVGRAGAMRSWHMDVHALLPANDATDLAVNPQAVHDYASRHSSTMNIMGDHDAPQGYIEYTGTGHGNDYDKVRILLDYKNGRIFLTCHYQFWSVAAGTSHTHGQNPAGNADKNNPWLNLDMSA